MKFNNWSYKDFKEWLALLPSCELMNPHNKILLSGEIHVDNSVPKDDKIKTNAGIKRRINNEL